MSEREVIARFRGDYAPFSNFSNHSVHFGGILYRNADTEAGGMIFCQR